MKKSRCTYMYTFILSCVLMTVMNITTAKTIDRGEIKFERGSYSGTVSGVVIRGERDKYSLMAGAGQWMKVKISSLENNAVFQLSIYQYGTGKDVQLVDAKDGDDADYWQGWLPRPGFSKNGKQNAVNIVVGGTRGNTSYDLTVTLKNRKKPVIDGEQSCTEHTTQFDMNECAKIEFQKADKELNRVYKLIRKLYKDDTVFLDKLHSAQLAWIKSRDADFDLKYPYTKNHEESRTHYGSIFPMCANNYKTQLTLARVEFLKQWATGIEEGDVCGGTIRLQ